MKKIFRMANAELNKIFLRPSMFVFATVLILSLVISFFIFNPTPTTEKQTYDGINASQIFLNFENDRQKTLTPNENEEITHGIVLAQNNINIYLNTNALSNLKKAFNEAFESTNETGQFYVLYNKVISMDKTQLKPSEEVRGELEAELSLFSAKLTSIKLTLSSIGKGALNFFIKTSDYDRLYKTIKDIDNNLPTSSELVNFTTKDIIERFNLILNSYEIKSLNPFVQSLKEIEIDNTKLTALIDKYYSNNIAQSTEIGQATYSETGKLLELYNDIKDYYNSNASKSDKETLQTLNEKIAKYYDYIRINKNLIENNFELLRIGLKTDDEIVSYVGFSGTSVYNLKKEITTGNYFLENNTFGYEYLNAFNFNTSSGTSTNAYDFTFYAMQILAFLITLFVIFFASGIITGEQNNGTLKMTAIRPYTRNKIYSGKFLACFNVALILMAISLVASLVVGIACFGFTPNNVLLVINASSVIVVHPILVILIQFISLLIDIVFYLSLALLISMLIKHQTVSTAVTSSICLISTILAGTVTASWIRFIPSLNTGLYKFFTNSKPGLFSYSIVPSINLVQSLIIITASIFVFDIISRILFKGKSLDK